MVCRYERERERERERYRERREGVRERERVWKVREKDNQRIGAQPLTFGRTLALFAVSLTKINRLGWR